ncbi:MAG: biotin carboxyl carrier domain-containing protein [Alphaproteobacteria bacterium]|nr:biotin carboxyl carrier domain-containing protein [Alphaproteobacteria bacterium]
MVGTFYRRPAPDRPPFVEIGQDVGPDDAVCLVEVMKLFNTIVAGQAGRIVEICVEDATPVAVGQVLVRIDPAD